MRPHHRPAYSDTVLNTKPVFYVPMQGSRVRELVKGPAATNNNGVLLGQPGPWPGGVAARFSANTADHDNLSIATDTSYHPGDTFSVGGWVNRRGAGDAANVPCILHLGTGDMVVNFELAGQLALRTSGGGLVFITTSTFTTYPTGFMHVMFVKNAGSTCVCYINGVSVAGTFTNRTVVAAAAALVFGMNQSGTGDIDASMAHWAIWNKVLSLNDTLELWRAGLRQT